MVHYDEKKSKTTGAAQTRRSRARAATWQARARAQRKKLPTYLPHGGGLPAPKATYLPIRY